MANELSLLMPNILGAALIKLRSTCIMNKLVKKDFTNEVGKPGQAIDFKGRSVFTTNAVTAGSTTIQNIATAGVRMNLNIYREVTFALTDKEVADLQKHKGLVLTDSIEDATQAISEYFNAQILANYKGFYTTTGVVGTVPSSIADITDIKKAARALKWPVDMNRNILWDGPSEAKMLQLNILTDKSATGDDTVITGDLGRRFSFLHSTDQQVDDLAHTAGTQDGGYLVDQADHAIGDKTVNIDTGTGTYLEGDIFTVAGDTQQYVVTTSELTGGDDKALAYEPAAKVAWANNAAITFLATQSHFSLAFHRDAIGLAIRPLPKSLSPAKLQEVVSDPISGLSMRLTIEGSHAQDIMTLDMLGGTGVLDRALGIRVQSGA